VFVENFREKNLTPKDIKSSSSILGTWTISCLGSLKLPFPWVYSQFIPILVFISLGCPNPIYIERKGKIVTLLVTENSPARDKDNASGLMTPTRQSNSNSAALFNILFLLLLFILRCCCSSSFIIPCILLLLLLLLLFLLVLHIIS